MLLGVGGAGGSAAAAPKPPRAPAAAAGRAAPAAPPPPRPPRPPRPPPPPPAPAATSAGAISSTCLINASFAADCGFAFSLSASARASLYALAAFRARFSICVVSVKICCTSGVIFTRGSILIAIGWLWLCPFTVKRTEYAPGATHGELTPGYVRCGTAPPPPPPPRPPPPPPPIGS